MSGTVAPRTRLWDIARLVLNAVVFLVALGALLEGFTFRPRAGYFPIAAAGIIVLGTGVQAGIDLTRFAAGRPVVVKGLDVESPVSEMGARGLLLAVRYLGWFVGFVVLLNVVGVFAAAAVFAAAFLRLEARWTWRGVTAVAAGALVAVYLMFGWLGLEVPPAYLEIGHGLL